MIDRGEILTRAEELDLHPSNVQRDYVFGWLLSGLFREDSASEPITPKGGNGLRKGYLPSTRFSDDLDFTSSGSLDGEALVDQFNEICRWAERMCGGPIWQNLRGAVNGGPEEAWAADQKVARSAVLRTIGRTALVQSAINGRRPERPCLRRRQPSSASIFCRVNIVARSGSSACFARSSISPISLRRPSGSEGPRISFFSTSRTSIFCS
jgi:hypothetical protein